MRLFLLLALVLVVICQSGLFPVGQSHRDWPTTAGTVERIGEHYNMPPVTTVAGLPYRRRGSGRSDLTVSYSYAVNGVTYADKYKIRVSVLYPELFKYYLPKQCVVRYDPQNPQSSILVDAIDLQLKITAIIAGVLVGLVLIGALLRSFLGVSNS